MIIWLLINLGGSRSDLIRAKTSDILNNWSYSIWMKNWIFDRCNPPFLAETIETKCLTLMYHSKSNSSLCDYIYILSRINLSVPDFMKTQS